MAIFLYTGLDLMCSSKINLKEVGKIREIFWNAQKMGRISNCLSTWEDELKEQDFTSATLAYLIDCNLISVNDLYKENKIEIINKINNSSVKKELFEEWEYCHNKIYFLCNQTKLIKPNIILRQLESFLVIYLSIGKFYEHRYNI